MEKQERVNHPSWYGGGDNPYEVIKIIEDRGLGFCAGNAVKYLLRAPHKGAMLEDLKKARWYVERASDNDERSDTLLGLLNTIRRWHARHMFGREARVEEKLDLSEAAKAHWGSLRPYAALSYICNSDWQLAKDALDFLIRKATEGNAT